MSLISIEEVDEAASVGELSVNNRANTPVLLVEGEVLLGMKQTRVLNLTVLVPAQTTLIVPVSCVEAGRWCATSAEAVGKSDVHLTPSVRAAKTVTVARSMRSARTFDSDQGAVWAGVDRVLDRHGNPRTKSVLRRPRRARRVAFHPRGPQRRAPAGPGRRHRQSWGKGRVR